MAHLNTKLTLTPNAPIDLHMHTTVSDGRWPAEQLIDYLATQGFQLVAITDHDRVDSVVGMQALGTQKNLPILSGVEMSTRWKDKMAHLLCYGFDPENNQLQALTEKIVRLQLENTHQVNDELQRQGYAFPRQQEILAKSGGQLLRPADNAQLLIEHQHAPNWSVAQQMMANAGFRVIQAELAETVEAVHQSGAVCLIAHPGRRERSFTFYTPELLDELRAEIPIDGLEVYHPYHQQDVIETYLEYVQKHDLLLSTGSDTHCVPGRMPIKYQAETSRKLLERLGIPIA